MNENVIVKEYELNIPLFLKIDSLNDNCIRDCHIKFFHTFDHINVYNFNLTNITKNEIFYLTVSGKCMASYELNKNITVVRQNGFVFNQTIKLTKNFNNLKKIYCLCNDKK